MKKNDLARFGDGVRALDRARERTGDLDLDRAAPDRAILRAISPIKIVDLTFSFTSARSGSNVKPLSLPPAIRMTGLVCASSAFSTASRLVALESLM